MRITVLVTSLMATVTLAACAEDGDFTPRPPVGEAQIECYGYEQIFTDPDVSVLDRAEARSNFFENDCVLRGGDYS
jgi:hypothetical protein